MPESKRIPGAVRVWISYADGDPRHAAEVARLWEFLRELGIDAKLDLADAEEPQDWPLWMIKQLKLASYILVAVSPNYRRRSEGESPSHHGRGVQYESFLIRSQQYGDQQASRRRVLPVLLPGASEQDIPIWLGGVAASTRYTVSDYTIPGAEPLLRYLTDQPAVVERPLGTKPVLRPRRPWVSPASETPEQRLRSLVRSLTERSGTRNEALVQAQVRQLLTTDAVGLAADDLGAAAGAATEGERRIDIPSAWAVIEVRADLSLPGVQVEAERRLFRHLLARSRDTDRRWAAVLTDGAEWRLYRLSEHELEPVATRLVSPSKPDADGLLGWLEALLATNRELRPTPQEVAAKLGAHSPAHALDHADLADLYRRFGDRPGVRIKRQLWSKLLTTALGTNFTDEDSLFINHTLLVVMAEVVGHAVLGVPLEGNEVSAATIMSGATFRASRLGGVVEPDFFDWVAEVPGGDEFVRGLARRLTRFVWTYVEHDVMKVLYESIISAETRHRLGEYYTPTGSRNGSSSSASPSRPASGCSTRAVEAARFSSTPYGPTSKRPIVAGCRWRTPLPA